MPLPIRGLIENEMSVVRVGVVLSPVGPEKMILKTDDHPAIRPEAAAARFDGDDGDRAARIDADLVGERFEQAAVFVPDAGGGQRSLRGIGRCFQGFCRSQRQRLQFCQREG